MKRILILTLLLFIGLTGYSQKQSCCNDGIHYLGQGSVVWLTEEGKATRKNTPQLNVIVSPFEKEIVTDQPLEVKIVGLKGKHTVWSEQKFNFQKDPKINLDLRGLIAGKYKAIFQLGENKSVKYFVYTLETTLLDGK